MILVFYLQDEPWLSQNLPPIFPKEGAVLLSHCECKKLLRLLLRSSSVKKFFLGLPFLPERQALLVDIVFFESCTVLFISLRFFPDCKVGSSREDSKTKSVSFFFLVLFLKRIVKP